MLERYDEQRIVAEFNEIVGRIADRSDAPSVRVVWFRILLWLTAFWLVAACCVFLLTR